MIDRAEVESLLACMERVRKPNHGVIAELCRVYLAWLDAPQVKIYQGHDGYAEIMLEPWVEAKAKLIGTRVRLVTDPGVVTHALNTSQVVTHEVVPRAVTDAEAK